MHLPEAQLARRGARIQQLLRPICRRTTGPAWTRLVVGASHIVFGTHDEARPSSHFRDWRFAIDAARHHAMYFELWRSTGNRQFVLEQAYLNLYERVGSAEKEVICLHCDPALLPNAEHAKYKRGPHIHMSMAGAPYDSAHIALRGPDLAPTLHSTESLHQALSWGIQMIREEIIVLMG